MKKEKESDMGLHCKMLGDAVKPKVDTNKSKCKVLLVSCWCLTPRQPVGLSQGNAG